MGTGVALAAEELEVVDLGMALEEDSVTMDLVIMDSATMEAAFTATIIISLALEEAQGEEG